jgi:hypothetical protein
LFGDGGFRRRRSWDLEHDDRDRVGRGWERSHAAEQRRQDQRMGRRTTQDGRDAPGAAYWCG